ncbi:alpha/beta fold hydrolase [Coxiella endosymbiont of Ornithodoros amblus]|uniref:alpha/beta hydrolase n=1 Tax=Coxiella endosymbiont of Ornithodoros amblus TaxID=1656166 RepID=UPI00244DB66B|nr:alpha/beta fold hydrolase [Coxiella endosymbiont of Ornithodoros amblus]MBW5802860.1 alpha/beta fold hydrolase [Coxiella endosymbiont of Ornithodoros amblus]
MTNENFLIQGPVGQLEVTITRPKVIEKSMTGIICHPHPLHGGTINNKVVATLAKALDKLGLKTVRFNFRGVGKSQGQYDNGVGEAEDLKSVLRWVKHSWPQDDIWLAGFSFGAYIAAKVANSQKIARLISIAPPVFYEGFDALTQMTAAWLIIQGDQDEVVPFEQLKAFVNQVSSPVEFVVMSGASHFFHGRLIELRELLVRNLA